jgi:hypothetical protein
MEAIQKRCPWCVNYSVRDDDCRSDKCEYEPAVRTRVKVHNKRRRSEVFRDLMGNHVDDCGDKKLLKPRKLRTTAQDTPY